jgi:hypothetical protein
MEQLPGIHDGVHCIALSGARPKSLYVATSRDPYRTDDEGDDWEVISGGVDGRYALHIAAGPDDTDLVLLTASGNSRRENPPVLPLYRRRPQLEAHHVGG